MHYVYTYRDPRPRNNNVVVYVGKGVGERAYSPWKNPDRSSNIRLRNLLNLLRREGLEPIIEIVFEFDTEREALDKEIELIALYGRAEFKKGPLYNSTDGGEGCINRGPLSLAKIGRGAKKNWLDPAYREKCTEAMKKTQLEPKEKSRKGRATKTGWTDEETRRKRTEGIQAAQTPEMVAKRCATNKENWTEEKRAAFAIKMKKQCEDPEHLKRRAEAAKIAWAKRKEKGSTPEEQQAKSEKAKLVWAAKKAKGVTPEEREKWSEAAKQRWVIRRKEKA